MSVEGTSPSDRSTKSSWHGFLNSLRERMQPAAEPTTLPDDPYSGLREVVDDSRPAERFATEAAAAGCCVHRVGEENWLATIRDILKSSSKTQRAADSSPRGTAQAEARSHVLTFPRSHVPTFSRSHVPTFPRSHVPTFSRSHVPTFPRSHVVVEPSPETELTADRVSALREALAADNITVVTERDDETLFNADAAITGVLAAIAETGTFVCASGASSARGSSLIPPVHIALLSAAQIVGDLFDYFDQLDPKDGLPANVNLITGPSKTADIEGILVTGVHGPGAVHVVLLE